MAFLPTAPTYMMGGFGYQHTPPQQVGQPQPMAAPTTSSSVPLYGAPDLNPDPVQTRLMYDTYTNQPQGYSRVGDFGKKMMGPVAASPQQAVYAGTANDPLMQQAAQQARQQQEEQMRLYLQQQQQSLLQQQQQLAQAQHQLTHSHQQPSHQPFDLSSSRIPTVTAPQYPQQHFAAPYNYGGYPMSYGGF